MRETYTIRVLLATMAILALGSAGNAAPTTVLLDMNTDPV